MKLSWQRVLRRVGIALLGPLWFLTVLFALFFLIHAVTWTGRGAALALGLIVTNLYLLLCYGLPRDFSTRRRRLLWNGTSLLALLLCVPLPAYAPKGTGGSATLRAEHIFLKPDVEFRPLILSNMVPEVDQIAAGIGLARWVDPHIDGAKAARIRSLCVPLYARMAKSEALHDMGSVMGLAYAEVKGQKFDAGHYVALVPKTTEGKLPLLVFLHGSGGNFASYWTLLADFAQANQVAVICPSFGLGFWFHKGGVQAILRATDDATQRYNLDTSRVYLACLSNGGTGATRVLRDAPGCFAGAIMISAVLEQEPIWQGRHAGAYKDLPVFVIHGDQDARIPLKNIQRRAGEMTRGGAQVTTWWVKGEDHFLFFSQQQEVLRRMATFVRGGLKPTPPILPEK